MEKIPKSELACYKHTQGHIVCFRGIPKKQYNKISQSKAMNIKHKNLSKDVTKQNNNIKRLKKDILKCKQSLKKSK